MKKFFNVPSELLADFSEMLVENELVNELKGSNAEGEIMVEVNYRSDQKGSILELIEWLDDAIEDDQDQDDEDDSEEFA